jgi:3-phenylpropionate/trans-cinnamate dioxygenase ferredoxin reductase subunit
VGDSEVRSVLIVGACQAGVHVAVSLREQGYQGSITMVSAEAHLPYNRPPLSKALLKGEIVADSLVLRSREFYEDQGIDLVLGERVLSLTRAGEEGAGLARTDAGRIIDFDRVALTVGSRPRRLAVPGADADGVLYLRDMDDAVTLRDRLAEASRIVVVGGGFIGLEVAASARLLGKHVTVVLPAQRLMARAVGEAAAEFFRTEHESHGVRIRTQLSVTEVISDSKGAVRGIRTSDGDVLAADLVIVGIGADPRVELAEEFGLAVDNGIKVDEHALASDGYTVAAGDCANMPNPLSHGRGAERMRLESLNNATEQAKVAAASLVGARTPYRTIPWFWSDQFDHKLQVAGVAAGFDHLVLRGAVEERRFSVLYYAGPELIAAECVNSPADFALIRGAMLRGHTIPEQVAADATISLRGSAVPLEPELLETA